MTLGRPARWTGMVKIYGWFGFLFCGEETAERPWCGQPDRGGAGAFLQKFVMYGRQVRMSKRARLGAISWWKRIAAN